MNAQRREGKRAPPDPPILADAKGGRRTKIEGKQREPAWDACDVQMYDVRKRKNRSFRAIFRFLFAYMQKKL